MKRIIDIKADEKHKVINLFLQNFFDGLGTSFFYSMGIFIFLGQSTYNNGLHSYPLVFIIGGLLIILTSPVYARIESRSRTDYLLYGLSFFVILLVILSYFILKAGASITTGIILLILYQLIYYLRQTQFWGLSALSFNVLQSKRLFSVVSAGDLPAKFIGYSLVFKLLQSGVLIPENLIYFAVVAYLISFFFLNRVFKSDHHLKHSSHEHFHSGVKEIPFFGAHLIRAMSFVAFAIMIVVFIIDFSFTKVVMFKINNEDVDMYSLVSTVLYTGYGIASLLKLFITGRVFQAIGVKWTTLMMPLAMLIIIIVSTISFLGVDDPNWYYVRLFIFLYISFLIFRDVIGKPVFLTLFQPLSKKMRLKGHNVIKGFFEPLGMILSGSLLLLYYGYFEDYKLEIFALALFPPLILWVFSAISVHKIYNKTLENVINLRLLSGNSNLVIDKHTKEELVGHLSSDNDIKVLFALNHLKNYQEPADTYLPLLSNKNILIQMAAWETLSALNEIDFQALVLRHLRDESHKEVKKHVYFLLAKNSLDMDYASDLIEEDNPEMTENILMGWKMNMTDSFPEKAEQIVEIYLDSSDHLKYCTGLRLQKILPTEKGRSHIVKALDSDNIEENRSAIIGAFGFLDRLIVNRLFRFMEEPALSKLVKKEFINMGDASIPFIKTFLKDNDSPSSFKFVHILGQIQTDLAVFELIHLFKMKTPDLRQLIFESLVDKNTNSQSNLYALLNEELDKEIALATLIFPYSHIIESNYLVEELTYIRKRIFRIIALMYPTGIIKTIEEGYFSKNSDLRANSIETLVQTVKPEIYRKLQPVLEGIDVGGQISFSNEEAYKLLDSQQSLSKWTVASLIKNHGYIPEKHAKALKLRHALIIDEIMNKTVMDTNNSLQIIERVIMLKQTSLFENTPENVLVEIAGLVKEERYDPEFTLFKKGELGNCMYIIYSGKVRIHDGASVFAVLDQNDFFGDLSMLDTEPRSASATTETETVLLRLDQQAIYELMDDRVEVAKGIISVLCQRIRNLNEKYVGSKAKSQS